MACWCLKSPQSLSGTPTHPTMVTQKSVSWPWMNDSHIPSFHVNQPSHSWDKAISNSDLETSRSRSWVWSKDKVIQSDQYLINSLPSHFTWIRPSIPEIQLFRNLTLKNPRSRSWVRSKINITLYTQYRTDAHPFCFTSTRPILPEISPKKCLTLKKASESFKENLPIKKFSTEVLQWLDEGVSLYRADKQILLDQCLRCNLGSRSQKGHPVHFPRPIYSLSEICKVRHKQFWHERQQSLRQRTRRRGTENIKSPPQTGVT